MNFRKLILSSLLVLGFSSTSFAAYTIVRDDGGNPNLVVAGREYDYRLSNTNFPHRLEDVKIILNNANYDIVVPPGVQTGPNKYSVDSNGELVFTIRFHTGGASYSMTVENSLDPNNKGTLNNIQARKYPVTFSVTPTNPTVNANVPFNISVTALDSDGVAVTAFGDSVQVVDSALGDITLIDGSQFVNGQATNIPVVVKAGNPDLSNQFTLTLTLVGDQYFDPLLPSPNLAPRATRTTNLINLIPGAFFKLMMLFPGQTLVPGSGKTGAVTPQLSGVANPVTVVTVRRVDSFFNPILTNPSSPISLDFTSSAGGVDTPPFPFNRVMTGPLVSITADMNQVYFGGAGDRVVKVVPDGDTSKEDSVVVPVQPGNAESFEINWIGVPATITTDDNITVEIVAKDQNGDDLLTLNGPVNGAVLSVQFGGAAESRDWVDTNPLSDTPENNVVFAAGRTQLQLNITKFGSDARIRYATPGNPTAQTSTARDVNPGAAARIHFTIRGKAPNPTQGETWTPGTYPGNSGTPPTVKVGEELVVEARITDRRWNLISGGGSGFNMQLVNNLPEHYLEARHVTLAGPTYTFPVNGEFAYDSTPAFDKSFRVKFRTAGPNGLVSAPRIRTSSNLLGGVFYSSNNNILPEAYSKMVIVAVGEQLRPGIDTEADGKTGSPTARPVGVAFNVGVHATDLYFNPIVNGPFPLVNFNVTPGMAGSFVSGTLPFQMVSGSRNFSVTLQSNSNVQVFDVNTPARTQTVAIPVTFGPLHHFTLTLQQNTDKEAGVAFQATIEARDQYENIVGNDNGAVDLLATTGATTMAPGQVTLTNGVWTGNLTLYAAGTGVKINMSRGVTNTQSNNINVLPNSTGYRRLVLLLPGETLNSGINQGTGGKSGTVTPRPVGTGMSVRVVATDIHYNQIALPSSPVRRVRLSSNHRANFVATDLDLTLAGNGFSEASTTLTLFAANTHTIEVMDINLDGTVSRSQSSVVGQVGAYSQLQILAPGESNNPDIATGRSGTATGQKAGVPFNVTMHPVDQFWNIVPMNGGDTHLMSNVPAILFNPPNNVDTPGADPRPFTNGTATREVIVGQEGLTQITFQDDLNTARGQATTEVNVANGPTYVVTAPANATAGQPISVTVSLEENGVPLNTANNTIFLTAQLSAGGVSSGQFNPDGSPFQAALVNGQVTIPNLNYGYVESIKVKVTDQFNRVGFSQPIVLVPSGLKYEVTVPQEAVAGQTFVVRVRLLEQNTNTLVTDPTYGHAIGVQLVATAFPTTDGIYTTPNSNITNGIAEFQQSYTKAESVIVRISKNPAALPSYNIATVDSNNVNVKADGYKKLLFLAPGEVHRPGIPSATGKDSSAIQNRQLGVPFLVQVRGVDQFWNVASEFNGGQILFTSDDVPASLSGTNPINNSGALVNGEIAATLRLLNAGKINVRVRDLANNQIGDQTTEISVGGNRYEITVPALNCAGDNTSICAGAPFTMNITVVDSLTNQIVTGANHIVDISALNPDGTTAAGLLGATESNVVNGVASIPNQTYSRAETIKFRVVERTAAEVKSTGTSGDVKFIARQVRYVFEFPASTEVNVPFNLVIKAIDQDTGTEVRNLNRTNDLEVYSTITGQVAAGTFFPRGAGVVNIVNGVATIQGRYDSTDTINFRMTDNTAGGTPSAPTQAVSQSQGSIVVTPGAMASFVIADFTMQSNETRTFTVVARDSHGAGNPIPNQTINLEVQSMGQGQGQMVMNGEANFLSQKTNGQGELVLTFDPTDEVNGEVEILISDGDRPVGGLRQTLKINVNGFPLLPARARDASDEIVPLNTRVFLDLRDIDTGNGQMIVRYRLDGGPWTWYRPTEGILLDQLKRYQVESYIDICFDPSYNPAVHQDQCPGQVVSQLAAAGGPSTIFFVTFTEDGKLAGFPSPFNPKRDGHMTITYPLVNNTNVEIDIYDLFGQKVWHRDIEAGQNGGIGGGQGSNTVLWNGTNDDGLTVANGGYIILVKVGATGQTMKTKVLVVK